MKFPLGKLAILAGALLYAMLGQSPAAPVAVNDSYSTNEDTALVISTAPFFSEAFDSIVASTDTRGFTFQTNIFGLGSGQGGLGGANDIEGFPPGGLDVRQAASTSSLVTRNSGWTRSFTVGATQTIRVTMNYKLTTDGVISDAAVATVRLRVGTTGTITTVDQVTGKNKDTGWKTATYTFSVTAGTQTLQFGATATNNTGAGSTVRAYFDNVRVEPATNTGVLTNDTGGATSAILETQPTKGTLLFNVNGTFTYTPNPNFSGADSFTYRASDGTTTSNVATVSLTVNPVNDAPVAVGDSYTTTENVTLTVPVSQGVLVNDTDAEGQTLTAALVAPATKGTVTLNPNGSFTYVPTAGASGSDSFTYRASDGTANSNTVPVALTILAVNDPPIAVNDSYTATKNQVLNITATSGSGPATLVGAGSTWKYLDNGSDQGTGWKEPGFSDVTWKTGIAEFGYGDGDEATVVEDDATPGSPTPGSTTRYITTYFRKTFTLSDKSSLHDFVLRVKRDDGAVVYLNGSVISDATIQNGLPNAPAFDTPATNDPDDGQTFITISPANLDTLLVEGANVVAVEVHQSAPNSSDISFDMSLTATRGGSETLVPLGATWRYLNNGTDQGVAWRDLTFADASWKSGPAELGYGDGDEVTVVEDDATPGSPTPGSTTRYITTYFRRKFTVMDKAGLAALVLTVKRDDGAVVYLNGTVISDDTIQNGLANNPGFLDGANNAGDDGGTLNTVNLQNGQDLLLEGENILAVEVHQQDGSSSDISFDLSLVATRSAPAGVLANDIEPDGQTMTASVVTPPIHGALQLNPNGTFSYTPAANYLGVDSFVYAASDGSLSSNATATITVSAGPNSAPVAVNDSYSATEDTVLTVAASAGVLVNDTDAEGDPLTASVVVQPAHGSLVLAANGSFTYTPAPNFFGPDSFTYRAADPFANSIPATVTITVNGTPDAPVAVADSYATDRGVALSVPASGGVLSNDTDVDGQTLTAQLVSSPASGVLSLAPDGGFTYTPVAGFSGTATFTYKASDGVLASATVTVSILVNSRPVAIPDVYAAIEDTTLNVPASGVLANDTDPDGEAITAVLVTNAAHGSVTLNANGSFSYVPTPNFNGTDSFTYRATDGVRSSADVAVTLKVAGVNDLPVAVDDRYDVAIGEEATVSAALGVLANDSDPDATSLSAQLVSGPASGTLTWNTDGSFRFKPLTGFTGTVTFTYRASDGVAQSAPATVTINVQNQAAILISEIMFNAASGLPADEWIEIRNTGATVVSLRGWRFTKGVSFTFPDTSIAAGAYLVIAADVPAIRALFPAVSNVVGSWTGSLSNRGEGIQLENAVGRKINEVHYADQGDWATRRAEVLGGQSGWTWISGADGTGQSLQLRSIALPNDNGQNWASAIPTPGIANSGVQATNLPPLIYNVKHSPELPSATEQVHVTATLLDEAPIPPTARVTYRTWVRPADTDTTSTPTAWVDSTMFDDGLHGDNAAGDGKFGATIPAFPANTIVEFYVRATDGTNVRTWPAPTDTNGTQGANCLYFVQTPEDPGTRPFYRFVMTGQDEINFRFDNWPSGSDAALNATFIAQQGSEIAVRYSADLRIRGASSRDRNPRNWRVDLPHDNDWQGRISINLNTQYIYNQLMGSRLMELAGMAREDATVVQVRLNGINHATDNQDNRRFGHYLDLKPLNSDLIDEQFPEDSAGNAYHKVRPDNKFAPHGPVGSPDVNAYLGDGWTKQTNSTINDWTDLHALLRTFADTPAGANYFPAISTVADVDEFVRWFALCTIINHRETNLSNGSDDDYSLYRGTIDKRFVLIGHDFDTVFDIGDTGTSATAGIYQVTDGFGGTTIPVFNKFFQNPTIARKYKAQLRELLDTIFAPENFDPTVDALLPTDWIPAPHGLAGGGVPENIQSSIKSFVATRRAHIYSLIPQAFTAATSLAVQNGFPTTTNATGTSLSGEMDAALTAKVTVSGIAVSVDNYAGTWSAGNLVTLQPGLNTLVCKAFDETDQEIASATVQIVYDRGATTTKGGTLAANEVWTVAGGPYTVISNLTIPTGLSLTIEPGASVFMSPGTSFTVAAGGRLVAEGTNDAPISISKPPGATGTWTGLVINGGGTNLETRLRFVSIDNNGGVAITAQNGARVVFEGLSFRNPAQPFLVLNGSSFEISATTFPNATAAFAPVSGTGILDGGQAIIEDCVFGVPMGANSALTFTGGQRPGPILQVLRSAFNGSPANLIHLHGADAWIEDDVFMHCHRNSTAPSASAVSADANAGDPGAVTMIRNFFYDCDHAVTMREGTAFALLNNTIVRITNAGGTDTGSGVLNLANAAEAPASAGRVEGNIVWDATALTRHYNPAVTELRLTQNLLPVAWTGPGQDNVVADPVLNLSTISTPATATEQQVRAAMVPQIGSPAIATGPLGLDKGAVIPTGIAIGGVPISPTAAAAANLIGGPQGTIPPGYNYGYTELKYSVDGGPFSAPTASTSPITLTGLAEGEHTVSVIGKNDAGVWQTLPTLAMWTIKPGAITVVINELLASNVSAYPVGTSYPDIIELYNYGAALVDLSGFSVTDDLSTPRRFVFPAGTTIGSGQYLLLFGDDLTSNPGIHIGFGLDRNGDSFALYALNATGGEELLDSVAFGAQIDDFSIARGGRERNWMLSRLTPASANVSPSQLGNASGLRINEWLAANQIVLSEDFLELYNPTNKPVALEALHLTDNFGSYPTQHEIAPLSFIAPGGFTYFIADGDPEKGPQHLSFSISRVHETLALTDGSASVIDQVPVVSQTEDQSQGRTPDGAGTLAFFPLPTPGFSNTTYTGAESAAFQDVINNLRITEIMYQPDSSSRAEFVELKNISTTKSLNLSGVSFANGITYTFPAGTSLAPGAYVVLTDNLQRFQTQFPGVAATQWTSGKLDNAGERVRIEISPYELGILDFDYSDKWYPATAGGGASLQFIDPLQPRETWGDAQSWQASGFPTPGRAPVFAVSAGPDVVVQPALSAVLRGEVVYASFAANTVTFTWAKVSGPGTVTLTAPVSLNTDASFNLPGVYVLSLTARESAGGTSVIDNVEVVVAESFASWSTRTIANPALRAEGADAEKDGLINILEFAFGLDPQAPNFEPVVLGMEGDNLTLTYRRDRSAGNLTFTVQESLNLPGWAAANANQQVVGRVGTVDIIKASVPKVLGANQFLRVQVSY